MGGFGERIYFDISVLSYFILHEIGAPFFFVDGIKIDLQLLVHGQAFVRVGAYIDLTLLCYVEEREYEATFPR